MNQARHSKGQQHPFLYRPYSEKWKHLHLYSKGIQRFPAGFLQHHRIEDHPPDSSNPFFPDQHQIRQNQCKVEKSYRCIRISG